MPNLTKLVAYSFEPMTCTTGWLEPVPVAVRDVMLVISGLGVASRSAKVPLSFSDELCQVPPIKNPFGVLVPLNVAPTLDVPNVTPAQDSLPLIATVPVPVTVRCPEKVAAPVTEE